MENCWSYFQPTLHVLTQPKISFWNPEQLTIKTHPKKICRNQADLEKPSYVENPHTFEKQPFSEPLTPARQNAPLSKPQMNESSIFQDLKETRHPSQNQTQALTNISSKTKQKCYITKISF